MSGSCDSGCFQRDADARSTQARAVWRQRLTKREGEGRGIRPRPLCGRAGSSRKKGGSSYEVVRPPLMVNKATNAKPLRTHNNNYSRSAFNKLHQFPGIFFSLPSLCISSCFSEAGDSKISIVSAFIWSDYYQRLSSILITSQSAGHFIFTSLSSSGNMWRGCFDTVTTLQSRSATC